MTALALTSILLGAAPVTATFDCYITVTQPIYNPDGGYVVGGATYRESCTWLPPGYEVTYVARPNRVIYGHVTEQRNAAYDMGLSIHADLVSDSSQLADRAYLDTLRVVLDVRQAVASARRLDRRYVASQDSTAAATAARGDTGTAQRIRHFAAMSRHTQELGLASLVRATLDCIVDTVALSTFPIRHVQVRVAGDPELARLGGTWKVTPRAPVHGRR